MARRIGKFTGRVNGYLTGIPQLPERSSYRAMQGHLERNLEDVLARVEKRLKALGKSATQASKEAGLGEDAIRNMRRAVRASAGRRGVSTHTIAQLAPVLETTTGWLIEGTGDEIRVPIRSVPVVGFVRAGGEAEFYGQAQGPFDYVPAPEGAGENTVAVEIRGGSLGALFDGWLAFYDDVRRPITPDLIGELCIVGLPDERVLIKRIRPSRSAGLFHLVSQSGEAITDVEVVWAARVKHLAPRR